MDLAEINLWIKDTANANIFILNDLEELLFHSYSFYDQAPIQIPMRKSKAGLWLVLGLKREIDKVSDDCRSDDDYNKLGLYFNDIN